MEFNHLDYHYTTIMQGCHNLEGCEYLAQMPQPCDNLVTTLQSYDKVAKKQKYPYQW